MLLRAAGQGRGGGSGAARPGTAAAASRGGDQEAHQHHSGEGQVVGCRHRRSSSSSSSSKAEQGLGNPVHAAGITPLQLPHPGGRTVGWGRHRAQLPCPIKPTPHPQRPPTPTAQVIKRKTADGQQLDAAVGREDMVEAVARQLRVELHPGLLDIGEDRLAVVGEYRLPLKLVLASGEQAMLDLTISST